MENGYRYKKVMVVDDSQIDRYIAAKLMAKNQFTQETVSMASAAEALEYLRNITDHADLPDLIFLDIRMPDMDGFEFLEKYRELHDNIKENCIIVMISSSADANDHRQAEANSYVRGFVDKPLSLEKLLKIAEYHQKQVLSFNLLKE